MARAHKINMKFGIYPRRERKLKKGNFLQTKKFSESKDSKTVLTWGQAGTAGAARGPRRCGGEARTKQESRVNGARFNSSNKCRPGVCSRGSRVTTGKIANRRRRGGPGSPVFILTEDFLKDGAGVLEPLRARQARLNRASFAPPEPEFCSGSLHILNLFIEASHARPAMQGYVRGLGCVTMPDQTARRRNSFRFSRLASAVAVHSPQYPKEN
jgi:hypothetical protein